MMKNKILLIGGGGHCKSVLDSIFNSSEFSDIAIIDIKENLGKEILSIKVIGTDEDLVDLFEKGYNNAFISVGSLGNTQARSKLYGLIEKIGFTIPNIIDPTAIVSKNAIISKGVFIGKNAILNAGVVIGNGAIINTGAIIEHDCQVGAFSHISPGAVICGNVIIEENVHVGANAVVKQQMKIERNTLIGIGSVVTKNIPNDSIAYGNPCKLKSLSITKSELL